MAWRPWCIWSTIRDLQKPLAVFWLVQREREKETFPKGDENHSVRIGPASSISMDYCWD